jgi:hypothetical protein
MLQRTVLFLSSYSPVFVLLGFQAEWNHWWWVRLLLFSLGAIGIGGLLLILSLTSSKPLRRAEVRSRRDAGSESAAFLAGYLLPLITATVSSPYVAWATAAYLVLAFIITVRSSLIQVNPVLLVIGYKILAVEVISDTRGTGPAVSLYLITRRDVRTGDIVRMRRLGGDVFISGPRMAVHEGSSQSE